MPISPSGTFKTFYYMACQGNVKTKRLSRNRQVPVSLLSKKRGPGTVSLAPGLAEGKSIAVSSRCYMTGNSSGSKGVVGKKITLFYGFVNIFLFNLKFCNSDKNTISY